jgi:hypothetical protein
MAIRSLVGVIGALFAVLLSITSALASQSTDKGIIDAARVAEYATIFHASGYDWNTHAQVGGGLGPAEVVNIVLTYVNGDQLAEIQFAGDTNLYRVLIHPNGTVTTDGSGLNGKPICECATGGICTSVGQRSAECDDCHAIVQQNPQDGKKYVVCWADDPVCDDE